MRQGRTTRNRWLVSTVLGAGLLITSGAAAIAQNVPGENATAPTGPANGSAPQVIQLKPGQEAGTNTVLPADTAGNPGASVRDARFVWQASAGNQAEIMLGQLAIQRGQTDAERSFGQMLVTDHTQANTALSHIADTQMLKMAQRPAPMAAAAYQRLQAVPADRFDTAFNRFMIQAHQRDAQLYSMEMRHGQSGALRSYASETLPVIERHLQLAQSMTPMGMSPGPMAANGPAAMGTAPMGAAAGVPVPVSANPAVQSAISQPVSGNPDHSADQLNGRILNANSQS